MSSHSRLLVGDSTDFGHVGFQQTRKRPSCDRSILSIDDSVHIRGVCPASFHSSAIVKGNPTLVLEGSDSAMHDEHGENVQAETRCVVENEDEKERRDLGLANSIKNFPTILRDQILDGRLLGRGTSCSVYEVRGFRKLAPLLLKAPRMKSRQFDSVTMERIKSGPMSEDNLTNSVDSQQVWIQAAIKHSTRNPDEFKLHAEETLACQAGEIIVDHNFRNGGDAPYAIKVLSPRTIDDPQRLAQGLMDLTNEAEILSRITDHPNIIKMKAMCQEDPYGESDNIFILLDRLYDTLEKRLKTWRCDLDRLSDLRALLFPRDPGGTKKVKLYEQRLKVAYDISGALVYIHENRMMHRDVKPENMGFDAQGNIKIFDFGLAKMLPPHVTNDKWQYQFTAMCGTLRYMAPEVGLGLPYNKSCDTFSFSMVLWEMMSLERPYGVLSPTQLKRQVWLGQKRPDTMIEAVSCSTWTSCCRRRRVMKRRRLATLSVPLQSLVKQGWSSNPNDRPRMEHMEDVLRKEHILVRGDL